MTIQHPLIYVIIPVTADNLFDIKDIWNIIPNVQTIEDFLLSDLYCNFNSIPQMQLYPAVSNHKVITDLLN